ncbi:zonular occludens toxin domain-containing protein [Noviherbaspirillum sedimenti]|uniref:Zona occludens toxin N-terminal domain-containing protein n=1 Tax=Noviherbaspirillum sedimenti TaxID=2320865 RepID=A0A3A3FXP2_9BURK|nr:zonular occludens toxin domain-containing protein [Noviherbaspirillum sedimenti]RJG00963.1 hypothetical protein D3878_04645 [Noviherbaspirillum sedimenti]
MINLLLGAPGGGKSYEAVAYHVIPALAEGRKVITNLPLILDSFPPEQRRLLDIRTKTRKPAPVVDWQKAESMFKKFGFAHRDPKFNANAFSNVEDYGLPVMDDQTGIIQFSDPWRHPETGAGPLYVIDECHKALPSVGTPVTVEEWFAEHRHSFSDVLLMTQSHGKIDKAIKELVQVCYRVRKATHLGFSNRYIRKVLDGVNGAEMNESVREYDSAYFKFYRSHTQSSSAGSELGAKDIVPIWKHWTFKGAAVLLALGAVGMYYAGNPMKVRTPPVAAVAAPAPGAAGARMSTPATGPQVTASAPAVPQDLDRPKGHPLAGYGVHVAGYIHGAKKDMYLFQVSQNGQPQYTLNQDEITESGYVLKRLNDCIVELKFDDVSFYATCDAPKVGVNPGANMPAKST